MPSLKENSGQSLLETLIALSMLTTAFLGIATLLSQSYYLNRIATNETIGSYLSAEGIEVAKNIVDHDMYGYGSPPPSWKTDIWSPGNYSPLYSDVAFCNNGSECATPNPPQLSTPLKFDPAKGYQYASGNNTPFIRWVQISYPSNPNEIDIKSIVQWSTGPLSSEQIVDYDQFYNWFPPK